jgi:endonuclease/exonuclease/phosphatase family metal-dependent hydrolase
MLWKQAGSNGPEGRCGGERTMVSCARHLSITGIEGNASMRASLHSCPVFVVCTMIVCFLPPNGAAPSEGNVRCADVIQRGELNVLTINILFSEIADRTARFERIATFVQSQAEAGRPVDVMLLQEAAGGRLVKTENSAQEFREILHQHYGLDYSLSTAYASGVPEILTIFNATLSRCAVTASLWRLLPPATELACEGHAMPLTRSVLMTRLQVPGLGSIEVYHTHLCADCQASERLEQAQQLVSFVQQVETRAPGPHPTILGGDFNTDLVRADPQEEALYRLITAEAQSPSRIPMRSPTAPATPPARSGASGATMAPSVGLRAAPSMCRPFVIPSVANPSQRALPISLSTARAASCRAGWSLPRMRPPRRSRSVSPIIAPS